VKFSRSAVRAVVLDVASVLVFVVIGRASHDHGESVPGVASTAWPFLAGLAAGWAVARAWQRPMALVPSGIAAWLGTVAVGMVLRVVAGSCWAGACWPGSFPGSRPRAGREPPT
jgi:hypothetical protein